MSYNVYTFDSRDGAISVVFHNLTKDKAMGAVYDLRERDLPAYFHHQLAEHPAEDATSCPDCACELGHIAKTAVTVDSSRSRADAPYEDPG